MSIGSMTVQELKQKLDNSDELVLIDCREIQEWQEGHIPQAQFTPLSELQESSAKLDGLQDKTIIIQCRSGKRSLTACQILEKVGFQTLYNLEGGILAWAEEGFDITKD